jgi:ketosteroid isomerase-like protein
VLKQVQHLSEIMPLAARRALRHVLGMKKSNVSVLRVVLGASLASLGLACARQQAIEPDPVGLLIARSRDSNAALMRGDIERYTELVAMADDFTLMSPFGGEPTRGAPKPERMQAMGEFFRNGTLEQEVVQAYRSGDMVVLALIERAHVAVGGLAAQSWALRVTLVYRRDGSEWRLVHRHADPLVDSISLRHSASLARGVRPNEE